MATNKTRIKIRHGSTTPTTGANGLLPYELGWDGTNLALYINNNGTIKKVGGEGLFLPLSGGTMTNTAKFVSGSSVYAEGNPMFYWLSGSTSSYQKQAAIFTDSTTVNSKRVCSRLYFREYSYNSTTGAAIEEWDQYRLPVVTADKTSANTYEILTSKSAVTIAQGGTGATTAVAAAVNLLLSLPTWTANPNDDTYFIRRDTAGGDAFGQVKASTIYNYIAGKTTVSNTWTAGTTAGPTIKTTVNGVAGTAVAIPSASKTASGIVTTGDQYFNGTKGFGYMARYGRTNTGAATRWVADTWLYNDAGTQVGEFWYDCGDATNITTGQYVWSQYSPNSTANTSTTGKKENYKLPVVTSGLTETKNYTIITTKNPADLGYYLPLSGGTMTGWIIFDAEQGIYARIKRKKADGGGWAYAPYRFIGNDNNTFASIGVYGSADTLGYIYIGANDWNSTANTRIYADGHLTAPKVYGAVWNDYAEYRKDNPNEIQEPGRCVKELGNGALALTTKRLERGCEIISDTFGFAIGQDEENGYNTPIASNGRVLAYPYESIEEFTSHIGWPVCSGPNGTVSIMTEEEEEKYPSRIIGTISEIPTYDTWGTGNVNVNGRVWIKVH